MRWRLFFTVIILVGWVGFAYWFSSYTLGSPGRANSVTMEIAPKSSLNDIGAMLKERRIIREAYFFRAYAIISGKSNLKPGLYEIQPNESLNDILLRFSNGRQDLIKIILPPGFTTLKLGERLGSHGFDKTGFLKLMNDKKPKYDFEKQIPVNSKRTYRLEGYLFPGTYHFKKDEKVENIINEMLEPTGAYINAVKVHQKLTDSSSLPPSMTLDQIITVASLIEREGQAKDELPRIAGVIYNRMKNPENNKLMIDASIVYIYAFKGKNLTSITHKQIMDTKQSAYNTYQHAGLPPGPIACPSKEAIMAALNPEKHQYEYYVTRKDGTNKHYFSKTYDEHQKYGKQSFENEKRLGNS